jgi:hypothetical protein
MGVKFTGKYYGTVSAFYSNPYSQLIPLLKKTWIYISTPPYAFILLTSAVGIATGYGLDD